MPYERCGEVLRGTCALALSDEPLAGGVEYAALEVRVELPELGIALKLPPCATLGHLRLKHIEHFHSQARVQFHLVL